MNQKTMFVSIEKNPFPANVWFNLVDVSGLVFETAFRERELGDAYQFLPSPHNTKVFEALSRQLDATGCFKDSRWDNLAFPPGEDRLAYYCMTYLRIPERYGHVITSHTNQGFRSLLEND